MPSLIYFAHCDALYIGCENKYDILKFSTGLLILILIK